ncbi:MAG: methyltransferase domain-containing protein [Actinobacteria bacterium]|nr:methyltransferase domain-containing protein [Actinomycetota bacterium]
MKNKRLKDINLNELLVAKRYNRQAAKYDKRSALVEKYLFSKWRKKLISSLHGKILELGVGTGKNFEYYNEDTVVEGIDISPKMLEFAQKRLDQLGKHNIHIQLGNAEKLPFPDKSFDYVISTFVFCSVPDPVEGLKEAQRVLKDNGHLIQLEHVLSKHILLAIIEKIFNPFVVRMCGANINRDTRANIEKAGFIVEKDEKLAFFDIFRLFISKKA